MSYELTIILSPLLTNSILFLSIKVQRENRTPRLISNYPQNSLMNK
jgi:hypothetical protein